MIHIFMNERIRQKKPTKPVIVAQAPGGAQTEANRFNIYLGDGEILLGSVVFEPKGLAECETHEVKAWVELDPRVVSVRPAGVALSEVAERPAPVASAKNPNSPVNFLLNTKKS
jgi:hypothetical protein